MSQATFNVKDNGHQRFDHRSLQSDPRSLRYHDPEDRIFNRVISDISVVLRETTLILPDSIETGSLVETEIVRVVSLSKTEITEISRLKKKKTHRSSGSGYLNNGLFCMTF